MMKQLLSAICFVFGLVACSASPAVPDEPLQDRYWRVVEIDGKAIQAVASKSEPHVVLTSDLRAHGADGCNRFNGSYILADGLRFGHLASTMMACAPPVNTLAREFGRALAATASYRIHGKQLALIDADGRVRLRLEATFLK